MIVKRLSALSLAAVLLPAAHLRAQEPPRLVVFIAVDQMRADYLDRFANLFDDGLARLVENGLQFTQTNHAHAMTETAPGHATLVTGMHPASTGIPANEWWDRVRQARVYSSEDPVSRIVDSPLSGGRSPELLLRTGIGDWLKSTSPESKVYAVAIKDRVSILMGGKQPDDVYWYQTSLGQYVTSTYYASEYPGWLQDFNKTISTAEYVGRTWERLRPENEYTASRADYFPAEYDDVHSVFPHVVDPADTTQSPYQEFIHTPFADETTLSLARELIDHEDIGDDDVTDILFVGLSAADYIGHRYGPFSQEIEDYYRRLDGMLGDFLRHLDSEFGEGSYVTVLTADHGVVRLPEYSNALGEPGRRVSTDDFSEELIEGLTLALEEYQIYASPAPLVMYPLGVVLRFVGDEVSEEQMRGARKLVAEHLKQADVIVDVFTYDEMLDSTVTRGAIELFRRSFHPERAADIILQHQEHNTFPASLPVHHGSPYAYDSHVPFIVVAPGLAPGAVDRQVWTIDIAPSLAAMLGIPTPSDLNGSALSEFVNWASHRRTEH